MPSSYLVRLARDFQWQEHGDDFAGEAQGCLFTVSEEGRTVSFFFYLPDLDEDAIASIKSWLNQNGTRYRVNDYQYSDDYLAVRITRGLLPLSDQKLTDLLLIISNLAVEGQGTLSTSCAVCGRRAESDERGFYLGLYSYGHEECLSGISSSGPTEPSEASQSGPETSEAGQE